MCGSLKGENTDTQTQRYTDTHTYTQTLLSNRLNVWLCQLCELQAGCGVYTTV